MEESASSQNIEFMREARNENHNINSHYCRAAEDLSNAEAGQLNLRFYCAAAYRQCQFPAKFMRVN